MHLAAGHPWPGSGEPRAEPDPKEPLFEPTRSRPDFPVDQIPKYGDGRWDLRALRPPHTGASTINLERLPDGWREPIRRALWALLNLDGEHDGDNGRARRPSGGSVLQFSQFAFTFARWCDDLGFADPSRVDDVLYEDYAAALGALGYAAAYRERHLTALAALSVAGSRVSGPTLPVPPWAREGIDAYVVRQRETGGENRREPLAQEVIAPLLRWALRFVEDFSDDILAAKEERDCLLAGISSDRSLDAAERPRAYFQAIRDAGGRVPSFVDRANGKTCIAGQFIAGSTGSTSSRVAYLWRRHFSDLVLGAPAEVVPEVSGRIGGAPWREPIAFEDVSPLLTTLHSAALIVVGYLTGMRTAEVLNLRRGCCERVSTVDGRTVFAIGGRQFKHVREDGVAVPEGRHREQPWYAVAQVAKAIEVVEKIHNEDLLWPAKPPWAPGGAATPGRTAMSPETAAIRFARFAETARELALRHGRHHEVVPATGRITFGAFRRTLAWFIVWQPGGDLAAGLQYGHLEPLVTTQGYSGRSRSRLGMGDVINMERLRRVVDTLADAVDDLDRGERVSGPAADRYLDRVGRFRATFEGRILSERQMTQLRKMPDLRIYESPAQYLTCVMDPAKALCLGTAGTAESSTPNLTRCSSRCANGARTDAHVELMRAEAKSALATASNQALPQPIRLRYKQRADYLEAQAASHDETARGATTR